MLWPSQGVHIFAVMSAIPPLIALLGGNVRAFARSLPISILAGIVAGYTYLVPIAIVLLVLSFVVALQKLKPDELRPLLRWSMRALLLWPVVAIGGYVLWLWLAYNWGPPRMLEPAFLEGSSQRVDQAMTQILNSQFPHGTDEAALKLTLSRQGFEDVHDTRPECRSTATASQITYVPCPSGTREMQYDIQSLGIVCGTTHLFVN
jgi:hypothetical protein